MAPLICQDDIGQCHGRSVFTVLRSVCRDFNHCRIIPRLIQIVSLNTPASQSHRMLRIFGSNRHMPIRNSDNISINRQIRHDNNRCCRVFINLIYRSSQRSQRMDLYQNHRFYHHHLTTHTVSLPALAPDLLPMPSQASYPLRYIAIIPLPIIVVSSFTTSL